MPKSMGAEVNMEEPNPADGVLLAAAPNEAGSTIVDNDEKGRTALGNSHQQDSSPTSIGLLNLPNEVLAMIMKELPVKDLVRSRRICRKMADMFVEVSKAPVIKYEYASQIISKSAKTDEDFLGMAVLERVIYAVTSPSTTCLTVFQPRDCPSAIDAGIVELLNERCPDLKRLVLKGVDLDNVVFIDEGVVREFPATWELVLHNAVLKGLRADPVRRRIVNQIGTRVHGVFRGPFDSWSIQHVRDQYDNPEFRRPLKGQLDTTKNLLLLGILLRDAEDSDDEEEPEWMEADSSADELVADGEE